MAWPRPGRRTALAAGILVAAGLLGWGGTVGFRAAARHPSFAVRSVEVVGVDRLDPERILERAAIPDGAPWLRLDGREIRRRVTALPDVADVKVRRPWIGQVRLQVEEAHARARVVVDGRTYGVTGDLRVLPPAEDRSRLPLLTLAGDGLDPDLMARGLVYLAALEGAGLPLEGVELKLSGRAPDRIRLRNRGIAVDVEGAMTPGAAARNVAAFLETLDATGESRGTLRLISEDTAVWRASA